MSERVFLKTEFTPAGVASQVRKEVSGFLRYIQHRDQHPNSRRQTSQAQVSGLLKYVAYRDRASYRAELFDPSGTAGSEERKLFTAFVTNALEKSRPQLFRGRDGEFHDRRPAVHRMLLSPERAEGLDLRKLMLAGTTRLEQECGDGLRWMAAIHRNTDHHHIHFVLAGMRQDRTGRFIRVQITNRRLAALKEALVLEVERQRGERELGQAPVAPLNDAEPREEPATTPTRSQIARQTLIRLPLLTSPAHRRASAAGAGLVRSAFYPNALRRLQAVARQYQRHAERAAEEEARHRHWELVA